MCLQRGFLVCDFLPVRALLMLITHETGRLFLTCLFPLLV